MRPIARRDGTGLARRLLLALLFGLSACAPRELPPQLAFTPGPPYTLTDRLLITDIYTVETPRGWRVIASAAEDPYTFQFVAPDNAALIVVSDQPIEEPPAPLGAETVSLTVTGAQVQAGSRTIHIALVAPADLTGSLLAVLDAVADSLR